MKILMLAGTAFTIMLSFDYMRRERLLRFEYPVLILLSTRGHDADDLGQRPHLALSGPRIPEPRALRRWPRSIATGCARPKRASNISCSGVLSSGLLLYGSSLVYGFTGHTEFARIAETVAATVKEHGAPPIGFIFGLVFVLAGLAFKIAAVPFHMWTPDVYEGAPTPVTAYFAAAAKMSAMAMVIRIILGAFPDARCNGSRSLSPSRSPRWRWARSPRSASRTSSACSPIPPSAMSATR